MTSRHFGNPTSGPGLTDTPTRSHNAHDTQRDNIFPLPVKANHRQITGATSPPRPSYSLPTDEFDELNLGAWFFTILVAVFPFIILGGMAIGYFLLV